LRAKETVPLALASASLAAWVVLAIGRGRFWQATVDELERVDDESHGSPPTHARTPAPRVEAIVPARDESLTIGAAIASLVKQRYAGPFTVTLVDDDSTDGTAAVARAAVRELGERACLDIVHGRRLERPWTGKLNALDAGVEHVLRARGKPDYWLFTDADIEHHAENLAELVEKAERDGVELVSLMVRLRCESAWEKLLVPAFVFFFAKLYPFAWSNDPARATAAAAGGCILVRADALERIGGLQAIADRLIDDCALATAVKSGGHPTWLGLTKRTASIRSYGTLASFWHMVKRSAFTQLDHSYVATAAATCGMALLYVVPPALTLASLARRDAASFGIAGLSWALMAALYRPTQRAYERPVQEAMLLPLAATLYMAMTVDSAIAHARGRGGVWKGRIRTD
jgi:hopene-associated glycosyltransferase HpnB